MSENNELRAKARQSLGGGIFQNVWLMTLVVILIYDAILGLANYIVIGGILLSGLMEYGLCRVLVNNARGKEMNVVALFDGFKENAGDALLLGLLKSIFIFLWALLLIIPGIIKYYSYSMSAFIQQDESNKKWRDCFDKSIAMMDGYKMKLFLLDLSFIGWYIVGLLCLGIGILFVQPYHYQARAEFYEELKGAKVATVVDTADTADTPAAE